MDEYEVLVIGSGPAGQKAAIAASKLGRRAAIIERADMLGGVCVNTGTIPSKTMRESVLHLTGMRHREHYGTSYRVKEDITVQDLGSETRQVVAREMDVVRDQLARNHIALLTGTARFDDPHTVAVTSATREWRVRFDTAIIAVGTRPARPPSVNFDGRTVVDSDGVLALERIPASLVVVGAGVVGVEYASVFAALGTKVTVVESRANMLDFCDEQVVEALRYHLRDLSVTFRFGETVAAVDTHADGTLTSLASSKKIASDTVVYSAGRQGATEGLGLEAAGLSADDRGRIKVDDSFRTEVEHIYAVGDIIGSPPWRPRRWSRGGERRTTRAASRRTGSTSCTR